MFALKALADYRIVTGAHGWPPDGLRNEAYGYPQDLYGERYLRAADALWCELRDSSGNYRLLQNEQVVFATMGYLKFETRRAVTFNELVKQPRFTVATKTVSCNYLRQAAIRLAFFMRCWAAD